MLVNPGDLILRKHFQNAFWKSPLNQVLHGKHIDTILIAGYMAEHCVLSTYRGAIERGFKPILLADGVAGVEHPEVILKWCKSVYSPALLRNKIIDSLN
jgi:nicotinamidase-related amidase